MESYHTVIDKYITFWSNSFSRALSCIDVMQINHEGFLCRLQYGVLCRRIRTSIRVSYVKTLGCDDREDGLNSSNVFTLAGQIQVRDFTLLSSRHHFVEFDRATRLAYCSATPRVAYSVNMLFLARETSRVQPCKLRYCFGPCNNQPWCLISFCPFNISPSFCFIALSTLSFVLSQLPE